MKIFQQMLKLEYQNFDKVNLWLVVITLSVLIHLIAWYVIGVKWSKPQVTIIPVELTFQKLNVPKTAPAKQDKRSSYIPAPSKRNHEQQTAHKQTKRAPMSSQSHYKKNDLISGGLELKAEPKQIKTQNDNTIKKSDHIDVNKTIKDYAHEKFEKDILREKRHDELWFKSQSVMYGKPRDYFDIKQDKRAMLTEQGEAKKKSYFPKKKKNSDFGIKLGKHCFLGFKDMDKIKQGDPRLGGLPFSCDF